VKCTACIALCGGYSDAKQWYIIRNSLGDPVAVIRYFCMPYSYIHDQEPSVGSVGDSNVDVAGRTCTSTDPAPCGVCSSELEYRP